MPEWGFTMGRNQWCVIVFAVIGFSCSLVGFRPPWVEAEVTPSPAKRVPVVAMPEGVYQVPGRVGLVVENLPDGIQQKGLGVQLRPNQHQECLCTIKQAVDVTCYCKGVVPKWGDCREARRGVVR